jgi:hypothetical protein
MTSLASLAPEFAADVAAGLSERGFTDLVFQLDSANVERCIYYASEDGGYICLSRSRPIANLVRPVDPIATSVFFPVERGFTVDLGHDGRILGIGFSHRSDVVTRLKEANAL